MLIFNATLNQFQSGHSFWAIFLIADRMETYSIVRKQIKLGLIPEKIDTAAK